MPLKLPGDVRSLLRGRTFACDVPSNTATRIVRRFESGANETNYTIADREVPRVNRRLEREEAK